MFEEKRVHFPAAKSPELFSPNSLTANQTFQIIKTQIAFQSFGDFS